MGLFFRYTLFAAYFCFAAAVGFGQTVVRGPYLQNGSSTNIVIRWRTVEAAETVVRYGNNAGLLPYSEQVAGTRTEHEVRLRFLAPNTKYFYSIGTSSSALASGEDYYFYTSPTTGSKQATRVWVIGDSGTANDNARAVKNAFLNLNGSRRLDLWLMLGDNAYNDGTDAQFQTAVFDMYPEILRRSVLWSTLGNHETYNGQSPYPYFRIFTFPTEGEAGGVRSGTEYYYSFDYANIHFVVLDSMTASSRALNSPMMQWLQADLSANTQDWMIVLFHHPPYTKGSHNSDNVNNADRELVDMRTRFVPILEDYGVDLVLGGHSHSYERSYLIDGHYGKTDEFHEFMKKHPGSGRPSSPEGAYQKSAAGPVSKEGAIYAVAGSSGKVTSDWGLNHPAMYIGLRRLGSMILDVEGNRLDAMFLTEQNNEILDSFTIIKGEDTSGGVITLVIRRGENQNVILSWPSSAVGYLLEATESLTDPAWQPVAATPVPQGDRFVVEDSAAFGNKFYRLKQ